MPHLIKSYSELCTFSSYDDRFDYLWLGDDNHDSPKHISNSFYRSKTWLQFRQDIIIRDLGCDLGLNGYDIEQVPGKPTIIVHHINPVIEEDIVNYNINILLNPENAITTSYRTHNRIHYLKEKEPLEIERHPGDTKLW